MTAITKSPKLVALIKAYIVANHKVEKINANTLAAEQAAVQARRELIEQCAVEHIPNGDILIWGDHALQIFMSDQTVVHHTPHNIRS